MNSSKHSTAIGRNERESVAPIRVMEFAWPDKKIVVSSAEPAESQRLAELVLA